MLFYYVERTLPKKHNEDMQVSFTIEWCKQDKPAAIYMDDLESIMNAIKMHALDRYRATDAHMLFQVCSSRHFQSRLQNQKDQ